MTPKIACLLACAALAGCGSTPSDPATSDDDGGFTPAADDAATAGDDTAIADTGSPPSSDAAAETSTTDVGTDAAETCTYAATTDVNLREGPSTSSAILHVIPSGDTVTVLDPAPTTGFLNVKHGGETGWASAMYIAKTCTGGSAKVEDIDAVVLASACYAYDWKDRGHAPKGYMKGVARTFARAICNPTRSDVVLVSKPKTSDDVNDALSWYASRYAALSLSNDVAGKDTLRHVYTLLLGLGMQESTGRHCVGRDVTATNTSSSAAEAGAWQTSYDSHSYSTELTKRFSLYRTTPPACFLDQFEEGVTCSATDWENWGTGADGLAFQKMEKECPSFAAEYAAMMLRLSGGSGGHYGPLRTKAAELRPECDTMLQKVQTLVETNTSLCASL
jgi:uncharacterized protein YraI